MQLDARVNPLQVQRRGHIVRKENKMKIKLDTKKIYLAMAEKGITATEIADMFQYLVRPPSTILL